MADQKLLLPFVFIPDGAEAPAWWRAAHPDAVRLPARLVVRGGVQRVQLVLRGRRLPWLGGQPPARPPDFSRWLRELWPNIAPSRDEQERFEERRPKPPPGSRSIKETPWSGDHGKIKPAIGANPDDNVEIAPDGTVWGENPDGSGTNHGPAENFIEGSGARGRRGKDRDERRQQRRDR